ncbi:MAG: asparaginase [Alphaproteobacteria bacterium]
MTDKNAVLVEICRGDEVESIHRGVVVVADSKGKVVFSLGDVDRVLYPRSALKIFQALPVVASGITEDLKLLAEDYALLLASHSGEIAHTKRVAALLEKIDMTMDDLACGAHEPYHRETAMRLVANGEKPCPLHNNCSGKHSGMLMLARAKNVSYKNYINPQHIVQLQIAAAIEKFCHVKLSPAAIDGCSAPTFALPIKNMASGLARFGVAAGDDKMACDLLFHSAVKHPYFVAGTDRHCTKVMQVLAGKVLVKVGAEGFYAAIIPHLGFGVAIKIDDGADRAAQIILNGVLDKLELLNKTAKQKLPKKKTLQNFQGLAVGEIRIAEDSYL